MLYVSRVSVCAFTVHCLVRAFPWIPSLTIWVGLGDFDLPLSFMQDSNLQRSQYKCDALPVELMKRTQG